MFGFRRSTHPILLGAAGLLLATLPSAANAQGCTQTQCVAVQHVQVTVRRSMGLAVGQPAGAASPRPASATVRGPENRTAQVRANTAWHLDVARVPAPETSREGIAASPAVVRYTLVGS